MSDGKRLPLKPGLFDIPDDPNLPPYLMGVKCNACHTYFFPGRAICLNCGSKDMKRSPLKGGGKVYTYTIARQQLPGAFVKVPYAIAIIVMEEGCQIHSVITENWEKLDIDMDVEVYFEEVAKGPEGNALFAYKFRIAEF
jgi:uncharacterized protein